MMSRFQESRAQDVEQTKHCQQVSVACQTDSSITSTSGDAFDISIHTMRAGETAGCDAFAAGEEVGAVLSGQFTIVAADEQYQLSRGEGIIIPAGEPRLWTCDSPDGQLYRVVNRASLVSQNGEAA